MEGGYELGHVGGGDLVHAAGAEEREHAPELDAVADRRLVDNVHPRGAPAFGRLGQGWHCGRRLAEVVAAGDAHAASSPATQRWRASASRLVGKEPA